MKRRLFKCAGVVVMGLIVILALSACSEKLPDEKRILSDLPDDVKTLAIERFPTQTFDDMSIEILKRETRDVSDIIYCALNLRNDCFHITKYFRVIYGYYKRSGWIFDGWSTYIENDYQLVGNPLTREWLDWFCQTDFLYHNPNLRSYTPYDSIQVLNIEEVLEENELYYTYLLENEQYYGHEQTTLVLRYSFWGDKWKCTRVESTTNVDRWDIVGDWVLNSHAPNTYDMQLSITSFDMQSATITGYCKMRADNHVIECDLSRMKVDISNDNVKLVFPDGESFIKLELFYGVVQTYNNGKSIWSNINKDGYPEISWYNGYPLDIRPFHKF